MAAAALNAATTLMGDSVVWHAGRDSSLGFGSKLMNSSLCSVISVLSGKG
jgi:hypothetical protein